MIMQVYIKMSEWLKLLMYQVTNIIQNYVKVSLTWIIVYTTNRKIILGIDLILTDLPEIAETGIEDDNEQMEEMEMEGESSLFYQC